MKTLTQLTLAAWIGLVLPHADASDIVVVVSAKSTLARLDKQQVRDLFLGKSSSFPDGTLAIPIEQRDGTQDRQQFHASITNKTQAQLKSYWSKILFAGIASPPMQVPSASDVRKLVSSNPNMIGYLEREQLDSSLKVVFTP